MKKYEVKLEINKDIKRNRKNKKNTYSKYLYDTEVNHIIHNLFTKITSCGMYKAYYFKSDNDEKTILIRSEDFKNKSFNDFIYDIKIIKDILYFKLNDFEINR